MSSFLPTRSGGYETIGAPPRKPKTKLWIGLAVVAGIVGFFAVKHTQHAKYSSRAEVEETPMALYDDINRFVMEDYDTKAAFSDFLPGVAGVYGKPVWGFYVNRGQGIASFGTKSKETPMMEFNAANKAYQNTPYLGFRTFIQGKRGKKSFLSEPFSPAKTRVPGAPDQHKKPKRVMYVGLNEMEIKEVDHENGITVNSTYIVLPMESFSSFVRRTTYTNTGADDLTFSSLDGVARFEPTGGEIDWSLKNMGRTLEGWMGVYQADENSISMPFFKMSTEPADTASVIIEKAGHYCLSFVVNEDAKSDLLPVAYDPRKIFGWDTSMTEPAGLETTSIADLIKNPQYGDAKTSSAMPALQDITLAPGESITVATFYGKTSHIDNVQEIADKITQPGYVSGKFAQARSFMAKTFSGVQTNSDDNLFNGAVTQMFLDNSLRGGLPKIMGDVDDSTKTLTYDDDSRVKVFHVFSRIHGDLERDYNQFVIEPSYFSQGPGAFRDVAQNRRSDVFFVPRMASFDVQLFLGFIQADGYEPLSVQAVAYEYVDHDKAFEVASLLCSDLKSKEVLRNIMVGGPFRPGQIFDLVEQLGVDVTADDHTMINTILANANETAIASYSEGYWADHWDYYLDLINTYLAIYPDGEEALMYDKELRYFFSPATCKARSQKYVLTLTYDGQGQHVQQLDATDYDQVKVDAQNAFRNANTGRIDIDANWQITPDGVEFKSSPIAKLFLLATIKYATRDAYGMGVEYEGGKPGWNDAMNGLVGMVGSGMPETYELQQLLLYVKSVVDKYGRPVIVPEELGELVDAISTEMNTLLSSGFTEPEELSLDVPEVLFNYWNNVATARETYRSKTGLSFTGVTKSIAAADVSNLITQWLEQVEIGMARAMKIGSDGFGNNGDSGVPPCYFSYDVTKWELNGGHSTQGLPTINPLAMKVGSFPLFLEGPTRYLKTISDDRDASREIYNNVLVSGLRDKELKNYFLSASLEGQSYDMGRMMAFAPGWLENQSIWLHMSYKYYLQLIRAGLYEEFFSEMQGGGMLPYMNVDHYGRSLMQCSSFLASSAFPDPSQHGRGFEARLSGSTAEFLDMWRLMFIGSKPFLMINGQLSFQLIPAIPIWLFDSDADSKTDAEKTEPTTLNFKLFAEIDVIYHNSNWINLYDVPPTRYLISFKDGTSKAIEGSIIGSDDAKSIRQVVTVASIDAYF